MQISKCPRYAQYRNIGKTNNLKVFGNNKPKGINRIAKIASDLGILWLSSYMTNLWFSGLSIRIPRPSSNSCTRLKYSNFGALKLSQIFDTLRSVSDQCTKWKSSSFSTVHMSLHLDTVRQCKQTTYIRQSSDFGTLKLTKPF